MLTLSTVFLWFITYSFIGWAYESTLCSITQRKPVNRGFLNGPICPVYGFGALIIVFTLENVKGNLLALFLASAVLTCTLEYITSYLLEKLFKTQWWDYSKRRFNLNGRICLEGAIVFGLLSVLLMEFIHPFISGSIGRFSPTIRYILAGGIFLILISDTFVTVRHILQLNGKLAEIQEALNSHQMALRAKGEELKEAIVDRFENSEFYTEHIKGLLERRNFQDKRLLHAFPNMRSLRNEEARKKLKETLFTYKKKK